MRRIKRFFKLVLVKILFTMVNWLNKKPSRKLIKTLKAKYPNATFVTWEQVNKYIWKATFILQKTEHKALFNKSGVWLQTESYKPFYCLPEKEISYFTSHYNFENLQKVLFLEKPDSSSFIFEMNSGNHAYQVSIDTSEYTTKKKVS